MAVGVFSPEAALLWIPFGGTLLATAAAQVDAQWRRRASPPAASRADRGDWVYPEPEVAALAAAALSELHESLARQRRAVPDILLVFVTEQQVTIRLARPGGQAPAAPWQVAPGGHAGEFWWIAVEHLRRSQIVRFPPPMLVSIGQANGAVVLVNLAHAPGLVSIDGPVEQTRRVAGAIAFELLTSPWSRSTSVILADDPAGLPIPDMANAHRAGSVPAALAEARRLAAQIGSGPAVVILDRAPRDHELGAVVAIAERPDSAVTVLCAGGSARAGWCIETDEDGELLLHEPLGVRVRLDPGRAERAWARWDVVHPHAAPALAVPDSIGAHATGIAPAERTYPNIAMPSPIVPSSDRVPAGTPRAPVAVHPGPVGSAAAGPTSVSASGTPLREDWRKAARELRTPVLTGADLARVWPATVRVGLLGPHFVAAPGAVEAQRRNFLSAVVCAVALDADGLTRQFIDGSVHRDGASTEVLRDVAGWLGQADDGAPRLRQRGQRWCLSSDVLVDWRLFEELVSAADTDNEWARLVTALSLIRGALFTGAQLGDEAKRTLLPAVLAVRATSVRAVRRLAGLASAAGEHATVEWALRRGLTLLPGLEGLWRSLLLFQFEHDRGALNDTIAQMLAALRTTSGQAQLQPETSSLLAGLRGETEAGPADHVFPATA